MQTYRVSAQAPLRIIKRVPSSARNMAFYAPFSCHRASRRAQPFFPSFQQDFAPFFRMFDELENVSRATVRTFQPRFDVREEKDAFHLQGELPGIDQKDISIEFVDPTTLVIRGRTIKEFQSGTPSAASVEGAETKAVEASPEASADFEVVETPDSDSVSNYKRPSIEEERDESDASTTGAPTPATANTELAKPTETTQVEQRQVSKPAEQNAPRYWVSERSVGEFHRSFNFPGQIDQDAVTASLKNGILHVTVPKQQPKQPRTITIA